MFPLFAKDRSNKPILLTMHRHKLYPLKKNHFTMGGCNGLLLCGISWFFFSKKSMAKYRIVVLVSPFLEDFQDFQSPFPLITFKG